MPELIVVSGRNGYNWEMNGIYVRCYPDFNGRPQWEFKSGQFWIRWDAKQFRWVFDYQKPNYPFVELREDKLSPMLLTGDWVVWNANAKAFNDVDPNIKLVGYKSELEYYSTIKLEKSEIPQYIEVKGRIGYNNEMNGIYIRVDKNWEGRPQYVQAGIISSFICLGSTY